MTTKPIHGVPVPEPQTKRNRIVLGLVVAALLLHVLVCEWNTKVPRKGLTQVARMPNPARYVVGQGPRTLILSVEDRLGKTLGIILGLILPVVMLVAAGVIRLNAQEFGQIAGATACVILGFAFLVFAMWALSHW